MEEWMSELADHSTISSEPIAEQRSLEDSEMVDHSTITPGPIAKQRRPEDSGYLSATPDSLGFTRSWPSWHYKESTPVDQLFTPDPAALRKMCLIRQTPFLLSSTEVSVDLNDVDMIDVDELEDTSMQSECIDSDIGSLYEDLNAHDHEYNDRRVEAKYQRHSLSLGSPSGMNELQMKLETVAQGPRYRSWRSRLAPDMTERATVDFFLYLGYKSDHSLIVTKILRYLSCEDLLAARAVSTVWRKVIMADKASKMRLRSAPKVKTSQDKENVVKSKKMRTTQRWGQLVAIENLGPDREVKPNVNVSPPVSPSKVRYDKYVRAGRSLKQGDFQTTCPLCNDVSQVASESQIGKCLGVSCMYEFCAQCRRRIHSGSETCPLLGSPKSKRYRPSPMSVGCKQSRRNLKRL